jgi:hypothetical protein
MNISRNNEAAKKRFKKMILTIIVLFIVFGMGLMVILGGKLSL